jgi:uncharacterized protein YndB with AHSA1/START domain
MLKFIKWLLIAVVVLAAALFFGGYLISPTYTVARSATINAPADKVYALIADPREWKKWSVWNLRDPAMEIKYEGPDSGAGAKWTWKSKSQGDGTMTFTKAEPGKLLAYDLYLL